MEPSTQQDSEISSDLFRSSKRRKFYRKRTDAEDEDPSSVTPSASLPLPPPEPELMTIDELISQNGQHASPSKQSDDETPLSVAEILRQRKVAQRRRGGIEFTNSAISTPNTLQPGDALVEKDDTPPDIKAVIERFAPQTGQVSDVADKHMMAYIESELAKRNLQVQSTSLHSSNGQELSPNGALIDPGLHRQPAALGKLHEIDLGPDATLRNIALTEAAQRKLDGLEPELDKATGKVRLRRDGKPYGWRKRRNSDDVKRDKLVEEVMQESRLEIYDELDDNEGANDDQAADDRIAEQFRREFMDAISSRKHSQVVKPVKGKVVDDRPKGPKLGGSRSARAAMREKEEASKKK